MGETNGMDVLLTQLEAIRVSLVEQGVAALQSDNDLPIEVVSALPKVRSLITTLKQIQSQQAQAPATAV